MNPVEEHARRAARDPAECRSVVAVTLWHRGKLCLLRRSQLVGSDTGLWQCVTGYLESGISPEAQARTELYEETGLSAGGLNQLRASASFVLTGDDGTVWTIHPFTALTTTGTLDLNWEHDAYRWVNPSVIPTADQVPWLPHVLAANVAPMTGARR